MKRPLQKLKAKTIFISFLIVIALTVVTVYVTGIEFNRSVSSNLFISLGIFASTIFIFLTYCLYIGTRLINNYPKLEKFNPGSGSHAPDFGVDAIGGDGIEGLIASILFWIMMTVLVVILMVLIEALFWLSVFIIFASLYWVFYRALRLVLKNSHETMDNLFASMKIAFLYTLLYTGWLFGISFIVQYLR